MSNISYVEHTEKLTSDNMWVTLNGWKNTDISFCNLGEFIKRSNIQYSPYSFILGKKTAINWCNDKQNMLVFDIDDGLTIDEAIKILDKYDFLISTTKSHQTEKNNKRTDRFRVLLPSTNIPRGEILFDVMQIFERTIPIDKQVNTKTGAFLGNSNAESIYHKGKTYDCSPLVVEAEYILIQRLKEAEQNKKRNDNVRESVEIKEVKNMLSILHLKAIFDDLGYEVVGRKVKLREERSPSCILYNKGKIVDYGSGYNDDIFGFLHKKYSMTFKDSIPYIQKYL